MPRLKTDPDPRFDHFWVLTAFVVGLGCGSFVLASITGCKELLLLASTAMIWIGITYVLKKW